MATSEKQDKKLWDMWRVTFDLQRSISLTLFLKEKRCLYWHDDTRSKTTRDNADDVLVIASSKRDESPHRLVIPAYHKLHVQQLNIIYELSNVLVGWENSVEMVKGVYGCCAK